MTTTTTNKYINGLSDELMKVSGANSKATYTASTFSDVITDVIRIDFKDEFRGNFRTAYHPGNTDTVNGERGFRPEAFLPITSSTNYNIAKHFRVKQIDGLTGDVIAEGIALRWIPPTSLNPATGDGGTLFIKVLFHNSNDPTTFNAANGVIFCSEIDQFTYKGKTFDGNPMSMGSSIRSIQTASNVYKLTSVEAVDSAASSMSCSGGSNSSIALGKGLYQSGQRVHLKNLASNGTPCNSSFDATGIVISSIVDTASQKVSVFVEFDQPLDDTEGGIGNCTTCSPSTPNGRKLILCTGDASGSCTSACCIYSIQTVRKISTPSCGTVQKIFFADEIVDGGEFLPELELYQWKYELCGNAEGNGSQYYVRSLGEQAKIIGEYLHWDSASKILYVLCPGDIMKEEYGNVYQRTSTGGLISRGSGIASSSKFERKTGSFVNIRNNSITPAYVSGLEFNQSWESQNGGEKLVQTTSAGSTSYNPNYQYVVGETVVQALTEDSAAEENPLVTNYAAGVVVDWQPNPTALSDVPSILTIKRVKLGSEDPKLINSNNPLITKTKELGRFRYGTNLTPANGTPVVPSIMKNSKRNILPLRVFENIQSTDADKTDWYDFSSTFVVQNASTTIPEDLIVTTPIATIAKGSPIGTARIKALRLSGGNVYDICLMNPEIFYNEPVSFADVTQIGKSMSKTTESGISYNSIQTLFNIEQDLVDGYYTTQIYAPTSDKQITILPGSDVIENVISGSANFGSTLLTIQKLYNVDFTGNTVEIPVNSEQLNTVPNAEFPNVFSSAYSFAVDQLGNTLTLVKYNDLQNFPNSEPADNTIIYYDTPLDGVDRKTLILRKKSGSPVTSVILGAEVKCTASDVVKNKTQKQFNQMAYLEYQTSGQFKGKWTAVLDEYDVSSLISVFFVTSPEGTQILSANEKSLFGISNETDDYLYKKSILVLSADGVKTNTNTIVGQGPITPNIPKYGVFTREGVTSNYTVQISVSGYSNNISSNTAGIIIRESYKDFGSNTLSIKNIPSYISKVDGTDYHPSALIDCRGLLNDSGDVGSTKFVILPDSSTINTTLGVYVPRNDILYINKNGEFKMVYGVTSFDPVYPELPEDGMILYRVRKPSYIFSTEDLYITYTDNRRYTMRDIGRIDKRVQQLETYSALSLLEKSADSLLIEDANGNNRFKNGIIVDPFENHKIGEVSHIDYRIAIDSEETCLRPITNQENLNVVEIPNSAENYFIKLLNSNTGVSSFTGPAVKNPPISTGLFMLPYTETAFVVQPMATRSMSVTPFEIVTLEGVVRLLPREDDWVDTTTLPEMNVNLAGDNEIWQKITDELNASPTGPFGMKYGSWKTFSSQTTSKKERGKKKKGQFIPKKNKGKWIKTTTTTTNQQQRQVHGEILKPTTEEVSLGERVVDVSIIPYMRAKRIQILISGMKTNSRIYPFFDGIDVSQYCYIYESMGALNADIGNVTLLEANKFSNTTNGFKKTSAEGNAFIIFDMPGGVFRTGDRKFSISDNQSNDLTRASTFAGATFSAYGMSQVRQSSTATIRDFTVETVDRTEERTVTRTRVKFKKRDPLAQTFEINPELYPNGIFLSSIDLFFARKADDESSIPVKVELRPTVNGFPDANKVYPGATCILHPSEVNVSDAPSANNTSSATRFTFEHPVYLEPGEHSFVVKSESEDYEVYLAEIGQNLLNSTQRVTEQPYVGVFFASSNASTWLPQPAMDMMMVLNKCEFTINQTYIFDAKTESSGKDFQYELLNFSNSYQEFDEAKISWGISTTPNGPFTNIDANEDIEYTTTNTLRDGDSLYFRATGLTTNKDICPVINSERLSCFLVKNNIENDYNSASNGELNPYASDYGTMRRARYITKIVTLEEGFESSGFKLILSVNKPVGTKIKTFIKYQSSEQTKNFHDNPYVELIPDMGINQFNNFFTKISDNYVDIPFSLPTDTTAPYNKFAIKICLFSDNAAYVPKIQDLRGIAVL